MGDGKTVEDGAKITSGVGRPRCGAGFYSVGSELREPRTRRKDVAEPG